MIVESLLPRLRNAQLRCFSRRQALESLHERRKTGGIAPSHHNQMEMVGHETIRVDIEGMRPTGGAENRHQALHEHTVRQNLAPLVGAQRQEIGVSPPIRLGPKPIRLSMKVGHAMPRFYARARKSGEVNSPLQRLSSLFRRLSCSGELASPSCLGL